VTANRPAKPATAARIYDYFLAGIHNIPADRAAAETILTMFPATRLATQVNRAFLPRALRLLCRSGVTQFLDIGSGIPAEGNVHKTAQEAVPDSRVVYVDIDPVAVAESQEMLEHNEFAVATCGYAPARRPRSTSKASSCSSRVWCGCPSGGASPGTRSRPGTTWPTTSLRAAVGRKPDGVDRKL
jgi:hypothetical protein